MIQITPHMRMLLAREPLNFRKGIDGTAAVCRQILKVDPMGGTLFVFHNRKGTMLRFLVYDGQGFWLMVKRLSAGRFNFAKVFDGDYRVLDAHELMTMIWGGDPARAPFGGFWKKIS